MSETKPHLAILGSGPTGLEAALAAREHGYPFTLYEASDQVAGHVRSWGHVRLFTPWAMNVSSRMARALAAEGRPVPSGETCPTGHELAAELLLPLAEMSTLKQALRPAHRVLRVGRRGLLKHEEIATAERGQRPFRLLVRGPSGEEAIHPADVVLDCTGGSCPNPAGDGGIPAPGEDALGDFIAHDIPDFEGSAGDWASRRVLLVGAGHSAQTAARELAALVPEGTRVAWTLRRHQPAWGAGDVDPLAERASLHATAHRLATAPPAGFEVHPGTVVDAFERYNGHVGVTLRRQDGETVTLEVDRVLALTGKVGDHRLYRQLQVHECYATAGPMKLAAALMGADGGGGDCLQQTSLGPESLQNPEPGFFILGSKSYGRRNDYLMRVGWQQVDEVFQLLTGAG